MVEVDYLKGSCEECELEEAIRLLPNKTWVCKKCYNEYSSCWSREVKPFGNASHVTLPKSMIGRKVRITREVKT